MAKKKIKGDGIHFLGESSNDVTGSEYLVTFGSKKILIECGLHQASSNDYLDSYKINSAKFAFNPSEIDFLFVAHPHIDHCGLIPRLVKEGFRGEIISTANTAKVMKSLLLNCAFIVQEEAKILSKRYKRIYKPLYGRDDVIDTLQLIRVFDEYDIVKVLDENVSFQWLKNSHCLGAAQLQLILTDELRTRKILYTSDLGALNTKNHFVDNTEIPKTFNDVVIMESTYGDSKRVTRKTREYDLEHLKVAIQTTVERGGSVIMPCFSFSRTQEILTSLYEMFGEEENFKFPVLVDSMLSCEISELYSDMLYGIDYEIWDKVKNWYNVKFITDKEESRAYVMNPTPKIVISSSGFCTNGRIVNYLKRYIADENSTIVFSGYVGDNSSYLSYRIKNQSNRAKIKINKEEIPNRSDCISLETFSSHADRNDLLSFGSNLLTNKLVLVHGSETSKRSLAKDLEKMISQNDKTYRVVCSSKGMSIRL